MFYVVVPCHKIEMLLFLISKYINRTTSKTNKTNKAMSTDTTNTNTSNTSNTNTTNTTIFDGIHVSKGFVRGLQGQVLKLEQVQQSLIQQLEHANNHANEYHATAVSWQDKYDSVFREMNEMKQALERETMLRMDRERELAHFQTLLEKQLENELSSSSSSSLSPVHPHHHTCEPMSPVSVPSSPRPNSPTMDLIHDDNDACSESSRTTDCRGDPICNSDTE